MGYFLGGTAYGIMVYSTKKSDLDCSIKLKYATKRVIRRSFRRFGSSLEEKSNEGVSQCPLPDPLEEFLSCLISHTSEDNIKELKCQGQVTFLSKLECAPSTSFSLASLLLMYRITLKSGGGEHTGFVIMPSSCDCDRDDLAEIKAEISNDGSKLLLDFPRHCTLGGETVLHSYLADPSQDFGPDSMVPFLIQADLPLGIKVGGTISAPTLVYSQSQTRSILHFQLHETK